MVACLWAITTSANQSLLNSLHKGKHVTFANVLPMPYIEHRLNTANASIFLLAVGKRSRRYRSLTYTRKPFTLEAATKARALHSHCRAKGGVLALNGDEAGIHLAEHHTCRKRRGISRRQDGWGGAGLTMRPSTARQTESRRCRDSACGGETTPDRYLQWKNATVALERAMKRNDDRLYKQR